MYDYNARYYSAVLGRFVSPDIIVPGAENPQAWNRFAYVGNNPLKYNDPSGHCWGFASGLRNTFYSTTCDNIDMATVILTSPDATVGQKLGAGAYVGTLGVAHATVAIGSTVAAVGCLTGAGTVVCTGAGSAVTAASADGDPTNEVAAAGNVVSRIGSSSAGALRQFADRALSINGSESFSGYWHDLANRIAQTPNVINNNVFIQRAGDRIVGAMEVVNGSNSLRVTLLESIQKGTGTRLMQTAVRESIARGFGGRLTLNATEKAMGFYEKLGGKLVDPATNEFFFSEEVAKKILEMIP